MPTKRIVDTTMEALVPHTYRADIDGLRAVAVLAVLIFHLERSWLPGGFIGVDVFFTISGYLITTLICADLARGRFSLWEFYRRRVKRIAPAMLVVVGVTAGACQLLFLPSDARDALKSAVWSLASAGNIYFWLEQDTSYFAASSDELPLLHLWSLGVEEQFYLLWPLLLSAFYTARRSTGSVVTALAAAIVASFLCAEWTFDRSPQFAYYMLPARAGELLLGALAAIGRQRELFTLSRPLQQASSWLGAALVLAPLGLLSDSTRFPGLAAIPPTVGTAALILSGVGGPTIVSRVLSTAPMVWLGKLSYSAYLWHWPILAVYRYGYGEPSSTYRPLFLVVTLVLAWLTYRYVEEPLRHASGSAIQVISRQYLLPSAAMVAAFIVLIYPARFGLTMPARDYTKQLDTLRAQAAPAYLSKSVCQSQRLEDSDLANPSCIIGVMREQQPTALLWGDSNASHYVGMLEVFAEASGFSFRNVAISGCPPLLGDPSRFVDATGKDDCEASLRLVTPLVDRFDNLIVSASWTTYQRRSSAFLEDFFATVRTLAQKPARRVIIMGKVPGVPGYDRLCRQKALTFPWLTCPQVDVAASPDVIRLNERLKAFADTMDSVRFFDPTIVACPNGRCSAYDPTGRPRYYDQGHLTMDTSRELGRTVLKTIGVPVQLADLARSGDALPKTSHGSR